MTVRASRVEDFALTGGRSGPGGGTRSGAVLREQAVGLVLDVGGHGGQLCLVRAGVVSAEEQLADGQQNAYVSLGAAAVAAV